MTIPMGSGQSLHSTADRIRSIKQFDTNAAIQRMLSRQISVLEPGARREAPQGGARMRSPEPIAGSARVGPTQQQWTGCSARRFSVSPAPVSQQAPRLRKLHAPCDRAGGMAPLGRMRVLRLADLPEAAARQTAHAGPAKRHNGEFPQLCSTGDSVADSSCCS